MSTKTATEWGDKIFIYPTQEPLLTVTWYPKWWQFWKQPVTINVKEAMQKTKDTILANTLNTSFSND